MRWGAINILLYQDQNASSLRKLLRWNSVIELKAIDYTLWNTKYTRVAVFDGSKC